MLIEQGNNGVVGISAVKVNKMLIILDDMYTVSSNETISLSIHLSLLIVSMLC